MLMSVSTTSARVLIFAKGAAYGSHERVMRMLNRPQYQPRQQPNVEARLFRDRPAIQPRATLICSNVGLNGASCLLSLGASEAGQVSAILLFSLLMF